MCMEGCQASHARATLLSKSNSQVCLYPNCFFVVRFDVVFWCVFVPVRVVDNVRIVVQLAGCFMSVSSCNSPAALPLSLLLQLPHSPVLSKFVPKLTSRHPRVSW
jgi:hypothetical protein